MNMENGLSTSHMTAKVRDLHGLPRELAPPRDLWPGIAAQIGANGEGVRAASTPSIDRQGRRPPYLRWAMPLAAGLAAVVVGILLGRWSAPVAGSVAAGDGGTGYAASAALFDAAFVADRDRLRNRVMQQVRELPAEQRDQLLSSVVSLQRAVEDIQRALGADPANALLQELLVGACQQEMTQLNEINLLAGGLPAANNVESRL